ncbi:hypothetical protein [Aliidiomarina sanyensis]|uniref:hypothetical protein n=1 Tax=Aliidiomarina sanyensis TaxID=1249555 RepID=UPI000F89612E|nr:hypothetical protein [Aliidiomarina sanyensis]
MLALLLAFMIGWVVGDARNTVTYFYHIYTELFGKEPRWSLPDQFMYQNIRAFLATLSLLSPSIFLGIIIYKFFVLSRDNIVFRSKTEWSAEEGETFLDIHFYIASSLRLYNLRFDCFLRTYETAYEVEASGRYPMNTIPVPLRADSFYPLPYNYVPSRFRVPMSSPHIQVDSEGLVRIRTAEREIVLNPAQGDFCELYIIARGHVPELQARFNEVKKYRIPEDISAQPLPAMHTRFVRSQSKFFVENWQDFEPQRKRRGFFKQWRSRARNWLYTKQAK